MMKLCLHSPIRLHGVVLNKLNAGATSSLTVYKAESEGTERHCVLQVLQGQVKFGIPQMGFDLEAIRMLALHRETNLLAALVK
jgi:hypothetical protein